jgi:hypothetical protein
LKGEEAAKMVLMKRNYLFGSPSTILYRADLVRKRDEFYDPYIFHADTENCFELLKESNFAFVHQPLSYTRRHNEAATTFSTYYRTKKLYDLHAVKKFGDFFLTAKEKRKMLSKLIKIEHWKLARFLFVNHHRDIFQYHKKELAKMDIEISWSMIFKYLFEMMIGRTIIEWVEDKMNKSAKSKKEKEAIQSIVQCKQNNIVLNEE